MRQRHPWIFSGAIATLGADLPDGGIGTVKSAEGEPLALAYVNRTSQIVGRIVSFDPSITVDDSFFASRVERAVRARGESRLARLVNAESDGLPGLVVDRYGDWAVLQSSTLGIDAHREPIVRALGTLPLRGLFERSDVDGRDKEGLAPATGLLAGEQPPELVPVEEKTRDGRTVALLVDVRRGHKTGTYLDQAENRRLVSARARGAEILNLFSYTGGFGLHAAAAGAASVLDVDSSADALALSAQSASENGFSGRISHERADCFEILRRFRQEGRTFDGIVVDPPKFVHKAADVDRGARAYKDLFRVAMQITRPGGWVALFSCSGLVSADLFQKIVWSAALEARRDAQILQRLGQAPDHPVLLTFPEGEYLKGMLCRIGEW